MALTSRLILALLLLYSVMTPADLNDENKAKYRFLAEAVSIYKMANPDDQQISDWDGINSTLGFSTDVGLWLNSINTLDVHVAGAYDLHYLAIWLMPHAFFWYQIQLSHHELFLLIITLYLKKPFQRIDVKQLFELLNHHPGIRDQLINMLNSLPEVAKYILTHLAEFQEDLVHLQPNPGFFHSLGTQTSLNALMQKLQPYPGLVTALLHWLLRRKNLSNTINVTQWLSLIYEHMNGELQNLEDLTEHQLFMALDYLATMNPAELIDTNSAQFTLVSNSHGAPVEQDATLLHGEDELQYVFQATLHHAQHGGEAPAPLAPLLLIMPDVNELQNAVTPQEVNSLPINAAPQGGTNVPMLYSLLSEEEMQLILLEEIGIGMAECQ